MREETREGPELLGRNQGRASTLAHIVSLTYVMTLNKRTRMYKYIYGLTVYLLHIIHCEWAVLDHQHYMLGKVKY